MLYTNMINAIECRKRKAIRDKIGDYDGTGTEHLMEEYIVRFFSYVLLQSPKGLAAHLESYLVHRHYTSQLDNLEVDQLEVDWITWCRICV